MLYWPNLIYNNQGGWPILKINYCLLGCLLGRWIVPKIFMLLRSVHQSLSQIDSTSLCSQFLAISFVYIDLNAIHVKKKFVYCNHVIASLIYIYKRLVDYSNISGSLSIIKRKNKKLEVLTYIIDESLIA